MIALPIWDKGIVNLYSVRYDIFTMYRIGLFFRKEFDK